MSMRTILFLTLTSVAAFGADTWVVMGGSGSIKPSAESKTSAGALKFSYQFGKEFSTAILPMGAGRLAQMRGVRFWLKADHETAIGVVLAEKKPGGGDYMASVWAPKDTWQLVDLTLADFVPTDGPTDPVDANGRLDPDQVEAVGLLDFTGFFNQAGSETPILVTPRSGAHAVLIDGFEVLETGKVAKPLVIDTFDRGFSQWFTMGGMKLSLAPAGNPLGAPALEAAIRGVDGKLTVALRRVNSREFSGVKRMEFDLAAEHEGTFALAIETKGGPRYNFILNPPAGRKVFHVNVNLADFEHDENSPADARGRLEPEQIKTVSIADITTMTGGAAADNKIWIGRIEMAK